MIFAYQHITRTKPMLESFLEIPLCYKPQDYYQKPASLEACQMTTAILGGAIGINFVRL